MKQNNDIEKLFKDGFDSFEPNPPSGSWSSINNSLNSFNASSVASVKGLSFGISMAVVSLVGLVGTHSIIQSQTKENLDKRGVVIVASSTSKELDSPASYEQTVELIAEKDDVVRTNIDEIKKASVVSDKQKEVAKVVLEEPLEKLVISYDLPKNEFSNENNVLSTPKEKSVVIQEESTVTEKKTLVSTKEENNEIIDSYTTEEELAQEELSKIVRIPNVFTPNGDFRNDEFFIDTEGMKDFYVRIIDEKGKTIFESTEATFRWKGLDQHNNNVPEGNYYCVIKALGIDGVTYSKTSLLYVKR